ncbi:MAG: GAF domain-containing protein [Anaerolineae bacterium]|nr:GAF domain-containing protein [Anaerolineae bacterium]
MKDISGFDEALLEIYSELDHDRLMVLVVEYARDRLDGGGASIFLRDGITGRYVLRATTGILDDDQMPSERVEYSSGEGLTGWIAKHGRALRIANVKDRDELRSIADDLVWSKKYSEISAKPGLAYVGVPILSRDGSAVLGVLRVSGREEGQRFDERGESLLSHVAAMVSVAIENSLRYEREKRRARYFMLLLNISSALDPRRPMAEMLQALVDGVRGGFRAESCQIYLRAEDDPHRLVLRAASGLPKDLIDLLAYSVGEGLSGRIVLQGTAVQIREAAELEMWGDPHVKRVGAFLPSGVYRCFLGVPLQLGSEILGTLELVNKVPSAPGHRDWFTDDDEGYLRLLAAAVGGVLEGSRYLKALNEVGVTAMRMQRVASFGTLAQRIRHEAANPLAVARLAAANLRRDLADVLESEGDGAGFSAAQRAALARRLDVIEVSLDDVNSKLLDLLKFSQHIGFNRKSAEWNDVVREALIWLAAERQRRGIDVQVVYGELPRLFIESNELFGVLLSVLHLAMEAVGDAGGLVEIWTAAVDEGHRIRTTVRVPQAVLEEKVVSILQPNSGAPEELSPLHFEWALAQETVEQQYGGSLGWRGERGVMTFTLDMPVMI